MKTSHISAALKVAAVRALILASACGAGWGFMLRKHVVYSPFGFVMRAHLAGPLRTVNNALLQHAPLYASAAHMAGQLGAGWILSLSVAATVVLFVPAFALMSLTLLSGTARTAGAATVKASAISPAAPSVTMMQPAPPGGVQLGPKLVFPTSAEPRHIFTLGSTGCGKSQILRAYALEARRIGATAVIPVCEESLFSSLYDPERDTILCPYDSRSVAWSPLREIEIETDAAFLAESLIPQGSSPSAEEWRGYGRQLVTGFFIRAWRQGMSLNEMLGLFLSANEDLQELLLKVNSAGLTMTREGSERMLSNALATADAAAAALRSIPASASTMLTARNGWSVTQWVKDQVRITDAGGRGGFLWILLPDRVSAAMSPVASSATALAIRTLLSMPERESRRFYFIVDELGNLPRLGGVEKALTRGRKYGLRFICSSQSIADLREEYGRDGASVLLSCLSSQFVFRGSDEESATYASRLLGQTHVTRQIRSTSESHAPRRLTDPVGSNVSQSTSMNEQHSIEAAVLDSEIFALPDLRAYVRIAGAGGTILLRWIDYVQLPEARHEFFMPRVDLMLADHAPATDDNNTQRERVAGMVRARFSPGAQVRLIDLMKTVYPDEKDLRAAIEMRNDEMIALAAQLEAAGVLQASPGPKGGAVWTVTPATAPQAAEQKDPDGDQASGANDNIFA